MDVKGELTKDPLCWFLWSWWRIHQQESGAFSKKGQVDPCFRESWLFEVFKPIYCGMAVVHTEHVLPLITWLSSSTGWLHNMSDDPVCSAFTGLEGDGARRHLNGRCSCNDQTEKYCPQNSIAFHNSKVNKTWSHTHIHTHTHEVKGFNMTH